MGTRTKKSTSLKTALAILAGVLLIGSTSCSAGSSKKNQDTIPELSPEELAVQKSKQAGIERFRKSPMGNDTGMTLVSKVNRDGKYKTSYMIISKAGTVLVIDPYRIPAQIEADLILSTHGDDDHNDEAFYERTKAKKVLYSVGKFTFRDVTVTGIPSSHQGDDFDPARPSNVVYLLEMDGLRIAVMGDICQTKLNDVQLAAIGKVDVAFMIIFDAPQYGYTKERSVSILSQLQPRLIFPTHTSTQLATSIGESMGGVVTAGYYYAIDASAFSAGPGKMVLLGNLPE